ncbi:MAG TPA: cupin domain-containing protein [Bryobacteraceae bacterium]|jgi:uncharacterized cupin superfamily protein|nr:cupin domain-containing protein [Bryobacteraceae bacterium]
MNHSRRDLAMLLPALAAATAAAQEKSEKPLLPERTWSYEDLPVKVNGSNKTRAVFDAVTHTGYPVEVHITELGPGMAPHPPHRHPHEELVMVRRGVLDVTLSGKTTRIGPGSVVATKSNEMHGWKNPGPDSSEYFVIALGPKKA